MGACLDGSVITWNPNMSNTCKKFMLNEDNSYHSIDFSLDGRRYVVAGLQPQIEFYEVETNKPFLKLNND